ncbi:uncharacterized protein LOC119693226 [Plutella xylostella]|uniref:uncharacterized protein LOC119693226 n=1 Tax=Plutella xylostella TaxID=51655 RepID=UPI002033117F|nr:uncharacterized protein LOC119693226 [Plutella xylostella]
MSDSIFVFGEIFRATRKQDVISALPLELSWRIFSYLDSYSLRKVTLISNLWKNIILSNKKLQDRLNIFDLAVTLGSDKLAKFHRRNQRKLKKFKKNKNFIPIMETDAVSTQTTTIPRSKRRGDTLVVSTKRYKIF